MTESYDAGRGEQTRPLPPYRAAGPQAGADVPVPTVPGVTTYSPVPSLSVHAPAPAAMTSVAAARAAEQPPAFAAQPPVFAAQPSTARPQTSTFVPAQSRPQEVQETFGAPLLPPAAPVTPTAGVSFMPAPEPAVTVISAPTPPAPAEPARAPQPAKTGRDRAARSGVGQDRQEGDIDLNAALGAMVDAGASDLHLTAGSPPMIRLQGSLRALEGFEPIMPEGLRRSLYAIITQRQREKFEAELELDFAYAMRGKARFRVNLYQQRDSVGAAFRVIPYEIKPLEALGVPPIVSSFAGLPRGLVLVTGPTGSGKSTTLAAIIDLANRTRADHIMTVEDPIEFLHRHKKSLINQREVGADTHSFANALKHVLRQDPDIILVGEMRDLETISVALTAAETGHLVFATLHTQDAAQTIDRIIDVFPSGQQSQVRTQLAAAIQGVVCQTLAKRANGTGRAVATEVMVATPAIRNLVREGKTHQIYSAMQAGAEHGMFTMDQHLAELVKKGVITYEVGVEKCHHIEDFNKLVGRTAKTNQGANTMSGFGGGAY